MNNDDLLYLETRQRIYNVILKNPGLHKRDLARKINIPVTTLTYHLNKFEKRGLIIAKYANGYKRLFVSYKIGRREKDILELFRQEVPRNILIFMMIGYACSKSELSKELIKDPSTIAFHMKKLIEKDLVQAVQIVDGRIILPKGIIKHKRSSNEIIYIFKDMGLYYTLYDLLIVYKDSLPKHELITYFLIEGRKHLSKRKRSQYNLVNSPNDGVNSVIELFFEIFPHPYHV
jgi:predicted transcriptional regulator